jgi:hypothetical protein
MEASIPKTSDPDSIPTYLYSRALQDRYRLWTNSKSNIQNDGGSLGILYRHNAHFSFLGNVSFARLTAKLGGTNLLNRGFVSLLGGPTVGGLYYLSFTWEPRR